MRGILHLVALFTAFGLVPPACSAGDDPADPGTRGTGPARRPGLFTDVSTELGLPTDEPRWPDGTYWMPEIVGGGVALLDYDGDGDLDILQVRFPPPGAPADATANRLFAQGPDGRFADVTKAAGLGKPGRGMGVAVGDVDGDGDLDLYFTNFGPDTFYRNDGDGTFTEETSASGFAGDHWSVSAAFVDYDHDGDLDLYVTHYVIDDPEVICATADSARDYCGPQVFEPVIDVLYRNDGRGNFTDVTVAAGIDQALPGLGVTCADFNDDALVDIYVANDGRRNLLWVNQGDGTFVDEAMMRGLAVNNAGKDEAGMGVAAGDMDGDGRLDLYVTHLADETNTLYSSVPAGVYDDRTDRVGLSAVTLARTGFGCGLADFDNDGDLDIAVANGRVKRGPVLPLADSGPFWNDLVEPDLLIENDGTGRFSDASDRAGDLTSRFDVSRGMAVGDIDGDGDIDIVVSGLWGSPRVFRNDQKTGHHWLIVRARAGQRDAIGAEVRLVRGEKRVLRLMLRGSSYASSTDPRVHFGLGGTTKADAIEIRWPDGTRERFAVEGVDRLLEVHQGAGEAIR